MKNLKPYPTWVCNECGIPASLKQGISLPVSNCPTFHIGKCDVCGVKAAVTEPRDYGYPKFEGHEDGSRQR